MQAKFLETALPCLTISIFVLNKYNILITNNMEVRLMQEEKRKMEGEIVKLSKSLAATTRAMLKGTVNTVILGERKRGGGNRESHLLTWKGKGNKTRTVYVSKDRLEKVHPPL